MSQKKEFEVTSWEDANKALRRMGELKVRTIIAASHYDEQMKVQQAALDAVKVPNDKEYAELESKIKAYAARNKADCIGKTRTKKLSFGRVSWKLTNGKVEFMVDENRVLGNLIDMGYHEPYIRTIEEVNKDAVINLDENERLKAGIKITRTDNCTVKPDLDKIKEELA